MTNVLLSLFLEACFQHLRIIRLEFEFIKVSYSAGSEYCIAIGYLFPCKLLTEMVTDIEKSSTLLIN